MAFNTQTFRNKMVGIPRSSHFEVTIIPPVSLIIDPRYREVKYKAFKTEMPGERVATHDSNMIPGPIRKMPYVRLYSDLAIQFYDVDGARKMFQKWSERITRKPDPFGQALKGAINTFGNLGNNPKEKLKNAASAIGGLALTTTGAYGVPDDDFDLHFQETYISPSIQISQFTPDGELYQKAYLYEAFPVEISPITLDWSAKDNITTFQVTFTYRFYHMTPLSNELGLPTLGGFGLEDQASGFLSDNITEKLF